jgi:kynureninase
MVFRNYLRIAKLLPTEQFFAIISELRNFSTDQSIFRNCAKIALVSFFVTQTTK